MTSCYAISTVDREVECVYPHGICNIQQNGRSGNKGNIEILNKIIWPTEASISSSQKSKLEALHQDLISHPILRLLTINMREENDNSENNIQSVNYYNCNNNTDGIHDHAHKQFISKPNIFVGTTEYDANFKTEGDNESDNFFSFKEMIVDDGSMLDIDISNDIISHRLEEEHSRSSVGSSTNVKKKKTRIKKRENFGKILKSMNDIFVSTGAPMSDDLDRICLPPSWQCPSIPMYPIFPEVLDVLEKQIGRVPNGVLGVARFNKLTHEPAVIVVAPVIDGNLFPTTFWLCDRALQSFIGKLEADGWIKQLQRRIHKDEILTERLINDNIHYIRRRLSYLTSTMLTELQSCGNQQVSLAHTTRGIGGVVSFRSIRCLHMQYAMHLAEPEGNLVGSLLEQEFPELLELTVSAFDESAYN